MGEPFPPSLWAATATPLEPFPELADDRDADVCVVGGGFTGLSTALHLAERGTSVVLIEASQPGWGASGRNGGQVIAGLKLDPDDLVATFGDAMAERLIPFALSTPDIVFGLIERYAIACDAVRTGWIQPAHAKEGLATLQGRAGQWRRHGFELIELDRRETARLIGSTWYFGALLNPRNGSVQPLSYARGLARAAASQGVRLFGDSPATGLERTDDGWRVRTTRGSVRAGRVVLGTNGYTGDLWPGLRRSVVPVYSFQVATRPLSGNLLGTILPEGQTASDTKRLLWYYRKDATGRLVMGGRGRPKDDLAPPDTRALQAALLELFPQLGDVGFDYHWGGKVALTQDHLPHLHVLDEGLYAGLGYNGRGVAMATAMGTVLARLVSGESPDTLPFPVTGMAAIPFHRFRRVGVGAVAAWSGYRDRREREASLTASGGV
ncbi:NAD(P)/FAD-dependent oxidoreductase [Marinivivus vitaminiproducens]|uniref:NAD(P)/FAD-dependent oxidoreductase n=1 Tax=Marinivivus vitaminiproducens TaxID=3035935 RepID=UPI0027A22886|nr:FAD-binding oxidoreductase [Geminicoccaceae bacterium SCSIO 64248]